MPSQWKFEIEDASLIIDGLQKLGAIKVSFERIKDFYLKAELGATFKIRIFSNHTAKVIKLQRDEKGFPRNLERKEYESLDSAMRNLVNPNIVLSLEKEISYFKFDELDFSLHEFSKTFEHSCRLQNKLVRFSVSSDLTFTEPLNRIGFIDSLGIGAPLL